VGRKQVTIQFTIMYSRKHPDRPNFSARDKDTIQFGKKFVSDSPATLEAQWLSQTLTPQPDDTLKLSGSRCALYVSTHTSGRVVCVGQGGMVTRRFRGNFISCTHSQYASRYMTISCSMIIR
jgi:hypothetical protein